MSSTDTVPDFNDPNNSNDPPNWASLIWRLTKERPAFWMFALLSFYVGVRIFSNTDPLYPVIDTAQRKAHLGTASDFPDLTGEWVYTSHDKPTGKVWGGVISISVSKEGKIDKITVHGKRTWEAESAGGPRVNIPLPIAWDADGAAYLADKQVQWHYYTQESGDSAKEGATYVTTDGQTMDGHFSELCVTNPRWGFMELQRRNS